jgi:DNA/RNA-binding domain of Phe-tRNA-synthetase-like protein
MTIRVAIESAVSDLTVGLIEASQIVLAPSDPELVATCHSAVENFKVTGPEGDDERRQAVRQLLRRGGFKPSGRSKPAQEYLARAAAESEAWPFILNAVDLLNVISLQSGLPISLLAVERTGSNLLLRYGHAGESFVFNASGQTLDVQRLLCVCGEREGQMQPVATPVKDSQLAKVQVGDQHVLGCLYAPRSIVSDDDLMRWTRELARGWETWCGAQGVDCWLAHSTG